MLTTQPEQLLPDDFWFRIHGAEKFEWCPPGVDPQEWAIFMRKFRAAEAREFFDHPVQVDIELNSGCNMNCPFCWHGYETIPNKKLPTDHYKQRVKEAVALGARSLKLTYINEPLMRRDLEELVTYARLAGMFNVYFVTNALLLKRKRRRNLLDSGLTRLFVSIDAATNETYSKQRTDDRFNEVVANVRAFIDERNARGLQFPLVLVSFLINTANYHEAEQFREQWTGVADMISFQRINEVPDRQTGMTIPTPPPDHGCKFPFKQLVVRHDASIQPCCKMAGAKLQVGTEQTTLREAWDNAAFYRKIHSSGAWKTHPVCAACMKGES